ncbi:hypothetical protein GCM10010532_025830 [Dactylosporangium siamense]|uniref:Molecular chaperone DnaK n=1 Tax=Dactylosporangium siamense TaxID=685454 RepID=A0A919PVQ1_9ACTN|nr:hypothetical protein Dsi01nite_090850 [Dactylosporangium siamense]
MRKAVDGLDQEFTAGGDRAARAYRDAVRLALAADPALARTLVRTYDERVPAGRYPFHAADEAWLLEQAAGDDADAPAVVFELATRAALPAPQLAARDRLAALLGPAGDADALVGQLRRWRDAAVLDAGVLTTVLRAHLGRASLDRASAVWGAFFDDLPERLLPELFEVHRFLGRGADAVRLADSPGAQHRAIACCLGSPRQEDVRAGIGLARRVEPAAVAGLTGRLGELLLAGGDVEGALAAFEAAGRADLASECLERLGRFAEALDGCPDDRPDRLDRLAGRCLPDVDALVERGEFAPAARLVRSLITHLHRARGDVAVRLAEVEGVRAAVVAAGRQHHRLAAERGAADGAGGDGDLDGYARWSRFEEEAGEPAEAALRAEQAGDLYRAHRLFRQAERFGDADRVLRGDVSDTGLAARAEARQAGGDLIGAARLYQQEQQWERAAELFERAGDFASAAACLVAQRGDDAVEDPRLGQWLRRAGAVDELARRCLRVVSGRSAGNPAGIRATDELRLLQRDPALSPDLQAEVVAAVERLGGHGRRAFDERAQAWVAQARFEIDQRFAGIWAMDLGTTTCAAAIYDTRTGRAVLCPWKGRPQFPSTLSLDREGNELIGLAGEEVFAGWLVGHVSAAKRRMGSRTTYRVRGRTYRPEEVAARLIKHGRGLVETYLAERVRERVGELARAELGELDEEWLNWAERHHDLRLERSRVLLTIPAYFLNNQKHATRDACRIAGLELVRLIHEPTAACMTAARERRLTGRIVVVDLGAGTLDVSFLDVGDGVYEVQQVVGDNAYGGKDFDAEVTTALAGRLAAQGIDVPESGTARRRLEVAAEYLKVNLSAQQHADYPLRELVAGQDARVELSRAELGQILAGPLAALRDTCTQFKASLPEAPQHLVLVGGPMLSPLVQQVVEGVFGLTRTPVPDPRTAVATGAALQAAVLDGKLSEVLLLDVTPLALGLRVRDNDDEKPVFSELIARNTTIPTQQRNVYTTHEDQQTAVDIEIYNGSLDQAAKIGQFRLGDITPAPRGVPQIEVTFSIDASCVLEVTAQDLGTGRSRSIRISDTTVLSPAEIDDMARRQQRQDDLQGLRADLTELVAEARSDDAEGAWQELRTRIDGYRPPATPPDPATVRILNAVLADGGDAGRQVRLLVAPLRDLAGLAEEFLRRDNGADPGQALTEGRHLARELRGQLERLRALLDRIATWNATLVRVATAEPDPRQRFRHRHDTGDHAAALAAFDELGEPPADAADARRLLACLAAVHDADRYRRVLTGHAALLGIEVATGPPELAALVLRALVEVAVTHPGGEVTRRRGFVLGDGTVVTNRLWLGSATAEQITAGGAPVERLVVPEPAAVDVALLRVPAPGKGLAHGHPGKGLALGHPGLVRVGDQVFAPSAGSGASLVDGLVDRLESFPEQGLRLFRIGLQLPASASGGPLVNDLGEVIGVLTIGGPSAGTTYALTIDSLPDLDGPDLDRPGTDRPGTDRPG